MIDSLSPASAGLAGSSTALVTSANRKDAGVHPFRLPASARVALPERVRDLAIMKLTALERIHGAPNKRAEAERIAVEMRGARGFSAKRLINLLSEYTISGFDYRVVIDKASAPTARGELALAGQRRREFLEWAHGFLLLNQREKFLPRFRKLMERLELWRNTGRKEHAMPGYDTAPPNAPGHNHPEGWSPSNLQRLCQASKFEKRALAVGRQSAAQFRPLVLTSRREMKVGQVFFFDDNVHDLKVRFLGSQGRVLRPLEFACLDYFSGYFAANLFKPTLWNEEEGKREMLRSVDFVYLLVHWLIDIGWREDTGTTLVSEKGTAKVPAWFAEKVAELTHGKVSFDDGNVDRRAACEGFFKGPARGNSRVKSPLEAMFNLVRNETSDLLLFPGQVGLNRDRSPEELPARESHEKELALAEMILGADGIERLRHDFLEWNQFCHLGHSAYAKINRRGGPGLEWWTHQLEGYVEAGLVASEWRLPMNGETFTPWADASALLQLNGQADAVRALLHASPETLTRNRKLSPHEVWSRGERELTRAPLWWLPLVLPESFARTVTVKDDHTIEFQDQTISPDKLRFVARCRAQDGTESILRPGTELRGYVNQFNPTAIYLTDERGRGVGECPAHLRVSRADPVAVAEECRKAREFEALLLKPVAKAAQELIKVRADHAAHNAAALERFGERKLSEAATAAASDEQRREKREAALLAAAEKD